MTESRWYELRNAVCLRDFKLAERLLSSNQALVSMRDSIGETVLHFLAVENDLEGVEWLHAHGFGLDTKNDFGTPVIFEVAQLGYKELILWFIKYGVDLSAVDQDNHNILEYLREFEQHEMVQFLLENVPNITLLVMSPSNFGRPV